MIEAIGKVRCPYKEKFGIPRQPHLVSSVMATIEIPTIHCPPEAFAGLEQFNFIWLVAIFHQASAKNSKVRPPRLGGNTKIGVFATRSPFRPNPISLSLVKLSSIGHDQKRALNILHVEGIDLVDATPIVDIKPYIAKHDTPWETASNGWLDDHQLIALEISWSVGVKEKLLEFTESQAKIQMIEDVLKWDPRPAFHQDRPDKIYHCLLDEFDIHFSIQNGQLIILDLTLSTR